MSSGYESVRPKDEHGLIAYNTHLLQQLNMSASTSNDNNDSHVVDAHSPQSSSG